MVILPIPVSSGFHAFKALKQHKKDFREFKWGASCISMIVY